MDISLIASWHEKSQSLINHEYATSYSLLIVLVNMIMMSFKVPLTILCVIVVSRHDGLNLDCNLYGRWSTLCNLYGRWSTLSDGLILWRNSVACPSQH